MFRRVAVLAALAIVLPLVVSLGASGTSATATIPAELTASTAGTTYVTTSDPTQIYFSPAHHAPYWGPSFNNPLGTTAENRRNLDRVYRMIESSAGLRIPKGGHCPHARASYPNEIKIALYSFSDGRVADALIRAHKRCISVQVLMNNHLTNGDVPAFGRLQKALGTLRSRRSWARRCIDGCRGNYGPLHTKMYLFTGTGGTKNVVTFGSSNMTGKAADVQWNDLFVIYQRPVLYQQFLTIFDEMAADRLAPAPVARNYVDGPYLSMFWPQPGHSKETDRVLAALKSVKCGAKPTRGTGYAGHTGVAINIHAMEGLRGLYLAQKIVSMRKAGCRVRVLYGLIAPRIHRTLKEGGVMNRRTIFDRNEDLYTDQYTHMKVLSVNGAVGNSTGMRLIYTGSENFSQKTVAGDEVWVRIPRDGAWKKYQALFDKIWNSDLYSAPDYKFYSQTDTPIHGRTVAPDPDSLKITAEDLEE